MENNFDIHKWQAKYLREDSSRKQTAVEWLEKQLINQKRLLPVHFNKAKQMEEAQIKEAFRDGHYNYKIGNDDNYEDEVEYYQAKYK